jgi:glucose/arabinose dehydrogenase
MKVAAGLKFPDSVVEPSDGSGRLFVTELAGKVQIIDHGVVRPQPFLDISAKVNTRVFGQGMYDIAFHPDYAHNGYFYVSYINWNNDEILARYQVSADDSNVANPHGEKVILTVKQEYDFHYGGQIQFGPDGMLYFSTGDGGNSGSVNSNSQNKKSLLGALLRLDVDHGDPYSIPTSNPYATASDARPELWAKGLRNPWRFSFDQGTGDLYIGDVGESNLEEIDYAPANDPGGENYGWNLYEADLAFKGKDKTGLSFPVIEYGHSNSNCSITGGYVYRGALLPDLTGKYIFGDYCSGMIWSLDHTDYQWSTSQLLKASISITSFGQGHDGEILVVDRGGTIYQLQSK